MITPPIVGLPPVLAWSIPHSMRFPQWIWMLCLLAFGGGLLPAQSSPEPVFRPTPLTEMTSAAGLATSLGSELSARRALESGLVTLAIDLYGPLLNEPSLSVAARNRVVADLATAYLELDDFQNADAVLARFVGVPTPGIKLKRAMAALRSKRSEEARNLVQGLKREDFGSADVDTSWWFYVRGLLADEGKDFKQAGDLYQKAVEAAVTSSQRTWFALAVERAKLYSGGANEATIASLRQTLERNPGRTTGYVAASQLAVALATLGRKTEAISLLQTQLQVLPRHETSVMDDWRLILGVITGGEEGAGRLALRALVGSGSDTDKQRSGLRLLARGSQTVSSRDELRGWLDEWIATPSPHPILEDLLYVRAQLSLTDRSDLRASQAEADANRILNEFPGSRLRAQALDLLTAIAWKGGFFRNAALLSARTRGELPAGLARAQYGVLAAEAYYRGKDFRSAADAYAAALLDVPAGVNPGDLIFQQVLSLNDAGLLTEAQTTLDRYASDPRLDPANRWLAEWSVARSLQLAQEPSKALQRVTKLLADKSNGLVTPDLRSRMGWLQMRLSFEVGDYDATVTEADQLIETTTGPLKAEVASTALLMKTQAVYSMNRPGASAQAAELLKRLRTEFANSEAAVYSFIVEADAESAQDHPVEAQKLLRRLADDYRESPYAPYALYQAALYAERRGAEYYKEAYKILEDLVRLYPSSDLVFYARLKQGNLMRLRNDYGGARTLYQDLVNRYKIEQLPDVLSAHMALADCYAADETVKADSAAAIYERIVSQPLASVDVRLEAGCKLGLGLQARGNLERARTVWWQLVTEYLFDESRSSKMGARGRYWMSRTVLSLGKLLEDLGRPQEALTVYKIISDRGLPGLALADDGIARTGGRPPR